MKLVGTFLSFIVAPVMLHAQSLSNNLGDQNTTTFFTAIEKAEGGTAPTFVPAKNFITKAKESDTPAAYFDQYFSKYNASVEKFLSEKNIKISFSEDLDAFSKAKALRKLHSHYSKMLKKDLPTSESQVVIMSGQATSESLDKIFGAGMAEKLGHKKDRNLGHYDRTYGFDKPVESFTSEIKTGNRTRTSTLSGFNRRSEVGGAESITITANFTDDSKSEPLKLHELVKNAKDLVVYEIEAETEQGRVYVPNALLTSKDVGGKRAIVASKDGVYEFRDNLGQVNSENKLIFVDSVESAIQAVNQTSAKKTSMKTPDELLEFIVPQLAPKMCSAHA